jgi:transglutaminase-like putative cysteine protease
MKGLKLDQQIPRNALAWMIGAQFVLLVPHITRIPVWVVLVYLLSAFWRLMVYQGRWSFPGRYLKTVLGISCFAGIWYSFGTLLGVEPTVALLLTAFALKTIELAERKDAYLLLFLAYFVCVTEFLFSQDLFITLYMLFAVLVITSALVALHQHGENEFTGASMRRAAVMLAQALPLMAVLFMVFPRIGPLWSVPLKNQAGKSGMSDFMSPGDVSRLSLSGDVAFRVKFEGEIPPQQELYWRGMVFSVLEENRWRRLHWSDIPAGERRPVEPEPRGPMANYTVIMEATQQNWLYALRYPTTPDRGVVQTNNFTLSSPMPVQDQLLYQVYSWMGTELETSLSPWRYQLETALPVQGNPRARKLARALLSESGNDSERMVERVLSLFNADQFYYTLEPPLLGEQAMDDFLFDSRRGFCEHYSAAFVYLMRAAGIPARVVAGYQGGEVNPLNGTVLVHQFDAHAWAEVWHAGRGWVRVDPTGAIAPGRIEFGLQHALGDEGAFLSGSPLSPLRFRNVAWINSLRLQLDAMNYSWQRFVLEYDRNTQYKFLTDLLGSVSPARVALLLAVVWGGVLIPVTLMLLVRGRGPKLDPPTRYYRQFCDRLRGVGLEREQWEAPGEFAGRVIAQRPDLATQVNAITGLYDSLGYRSEDSRDAVASLKKQVSQFRPRGRG